MSYSPDNKDKQFLLNMNSVPTLSLPEQEHIIQKLDVFQIQGRDKTGRKVLRVVGKYFPGHLVSCKALSRYLEDEVIPELGHEQFTVVYMHTDVERSKNYLGIVSALRSIYEALPIDVQDRIACVYFLHPSLQIRVLLATFGRFLFSGGLYGKIKYVNRVEFLWDHVWRSEMEVPDFVSDLDRKLGCKLPMIDYGLESDYPTLIRTSFTVDSPLFTFSTRCIA